MTIYKITREQFFKAFPPETRNITVNNEVVAELGTDVICDYCNADVFTEESLFAYLLSDSVEPTINDISDVICHDCVLKMKGRSL